MRNSHFKYGLWDFVFHKTVKYQFQTSDLSTFLWQFYLLIELLSAENLIINNSFIVLFQQFYPGALPFLIKTRRKDSVCLIRLFHV